MKMVPRNNKNATILRSDAEINAIKEMAKINGLCKFDEGRFRFIPIRISVKTIKLKDDKLSESNEVWYKVYADGKVTKAKHPAKSDAIVSIDPIESSIIDEKSFVVFQAFVSETYNITKAKIVVETEKQVNSTFRLYNGETYNVFTIYPSSEQDHIPIIKVIKTDRINEETVRNEVVNFDSHDCIFNSFFCNYKSSLLDENDEAVKTIPYLPMLNLFVAFNTWSKYAKYEKYTYKDDVYTYKNQIGLGVEIKNNNYTILYNDKVIQNFAMNGTIPSICNYTFGTKVSDDTKNVCIRLVNKISEDIIITEVYNQNDHYLGIIKGQNGYVKISADFNVVFLYSRVPTDSFDEKIYIGIYDMGKNICVINSTIGINGRDNGREIHSVGKLYISEYDNGPITNENIIVESYANNSLGRTYNGLEGVCTVARVNDVSFLTKSNSVFFADGKATIYPRDIFGIPTPVKLGLM